MGLEKDICEFCGCDGPDTHHRDCPSLIRFGNQLAGVNPKDAIGSAKNPHGCISRAVIAELGLAMAEGARKYRRHNYRVAPVRAEVYFDAANRHLDAWWEGEDIDPDSGLPHLTKAIASLFVIRDAIICGSWYDDRPPKVPEEHRAFIKERVAKILKKFPDSKPPYTEIEHGKTTIRPDGLWHISHYCSTCQDAVEKANQDGYTAAICAECTKRLPRTGE